MSAEIKTDMKSHSITSYWGGDHLGMMVQITSIEPFKYNPDEAAKYLFGHEGFIQLTAGKTPSNKVPPMATFGPAFDKMIRNEGGPLENTVMQEDLK